MAPLLTPDFMTRQQALNGVERLPRLSPMITHLLARLAHRNCEILELTTVVENDALLSAQILRLANSAAFARSQPINSVKHAVARVGLSAMRKFALTSSISNLFSRFRIASSFSMMRFNLHAVATGTMVELLSEELPVEFSKGAFVAGLLHDVGKLLIAATMPKQYDTILAVNSVSRTPLIESEREILGADHAELSGLAISRWDFEVPIQWAAEYHHKPDEAVDVERVAEGKLGLTMVVHKADAFVNHLGMSVSPPRCATDEPLLEFPGFVYSRERVLKRFEVEWQSLGHLFR